MEKAVTLKIEEIVAWIALLKDRKPNIIMYVTSLFTLSFHSEKQISGSRIVKKNDDTELIFITYNK